VLKENRKKVREKFGGVKKVRTFASAFEKITLQTMQKFFERFT
jgi:hypothetical protein